ncbi:MAG TPA: hypothetical protein VEO53_10005, partial [Candidatus Binatia bacterium]|nr:hypothetical protein [Candidatus Binatia bacterium]
AQFNVTALADSDADGLPDDWETNYFGSITDPRADPSADPDGDGMSNRAEYLAGTDPMNGQSYLKIEQTTTPGSAVLRFGAIANRTYTIRYTDNPGLGPWSNLGSFPARTTNRVETLADPGWTSHRFYSVVTPAQP